MKITLSPVRSDTALSLSVLANSLIVNGEAFDFAALPEGASLPHEAIQSDWFVGPVTREAGEICCALALPHGATAPEETLSPSPLHVTQDGPVTLPPYEV